MKAIFLLILTLLPVAFLHAQNNGNIDLLASSTITQPNLYHSLQHEDKSVFQKGSLSISLRDTTHNKRVYLVNDDPEYNKRYPLWYPLIGIVIHNTALNVFDTYVLKKDYTNIGFNSWKRNLKAGWPWSESWIWSEDKLSLNFIGHPLSGAGYFNSARSSGYNFLQSTPYAFVGAYWWKMFDEIGPPEREDIIITPVDGVLFGEILYRLSSNILDDRTRGSERVFREVAVGILDPVRGLDRLLQGKSFRVTTKEVYQKEPLNVTLYSGLLKINNETKFGSGSSSGVLNMLVDYGNPFEVRRRKPFDFFRFNMEFGTGWGKKYLNVVEASGLLFGKNIQWGKLEMLAGAFQHYDYYDNYIFELSTLGLGAGIISKLPVNSNSDLFTSIHFAGVPFGANSTRFGPDSSKVGDYNFIGGWEAKFESTLDFGNRVKATIKGNYFWTHTFVGLPGKNTAGNNYVAIINPRISIRIIRDLSLGFEQVVYLSDREPDGTLGVVSKRTQQKFFLSYYFGNFKHGI